jgi:hypothetical protein
MSYRALITFVQGDQTTDVFVPLSEDFTEAEYLADQIFGKAKSIDEAREFYPDRLDCCIRTWAIPSARAEWLKVYADQHWTLVWTRTDTTAYLTISGKDARGGETFMRRREFWLKDWSSPS